VTTERLRDFDCASDAAEAEVAQMPHSVAWRDGCVPSLDEGGVHFVYGAEWTIGVGKDMSM